MKLWDAKLPDENDWSPMDFTDDDSEWAYDKLFGKNSQEALEQIKFNSLSYIENLGVMPRKAFEFYFKVLVEYLMTNHSKSDPGAAESTFRLINYDMGTKQDRSIRIAPYLPEILLKIAERQKFYDADIHIFGDFKKKAGDIIRKLHTIKAV